LRKTFDITASTEIRVFFNFDMGGCRPARPPLGPDLKYLFIF